MSISLTSKKSVYSYCDPYIIAELGSNHNGDMDLAKKLILAAKEAGADCVKFQSWSKTTLFSRKKYEDNYFIADDYRDRDDYSLEEIVDAYAISEDELLLMKKYSDEVGIDCTSTPFSKSEADFLVDVLESSFIKVASMDVNNYPFLSYLASKKKPIILSTGLSELYEIDKAVRTIEQSGNNQIVILHCVAVYPPKDVQVNLNNIETLRTLYPDYPVGFSDHTLGTSIPCAAVAKGACIIEKHFTLDKKMEGWDHKVSANPDEMSKLVENAHRIHAALGTGRIQQVEDDERVSEFRRSIISAREIEEGEVITEDMLVFKRPGTGLPPGDIEYIVGKKAKRKIGDDEIIGFDDF